MNVASVNTPAIDFRYAKNQLADALHVASDAATDYGYGPHVPSTETMSHAAQAAKAAGLEFYGLTGGGDDHRVLQGADLDAMRRASALAQQGADLLENAAKASATPSTQVGANVAANAVPAETLLREALTQVSSVTDYALGFDTPCGH